MRRLILIVAQHSCRTLPPAGALGSGAKLALRLLVLTAARSGEVRGATWDEIDIARAVWTVPAERMKAGVEHRVPLATAALGLSNEPRPPQEGRGRRGGGTRRFPLPGVLVPGVLVARPLSRCDNAVQSMTSNRDNADAEAWLFAGDGGQRQT